MTKPKIYVFPVHAAPRGDCQYIALAEDGEEIAWHVSSNEGFGKSDMGVSWPDSRKHEEYRKKYPGGYELEYVPDWSVHPFLSKAQPKGEKGVSSQKMDLEEATRKLREAQAEVIAAAREFDRLSHSDSVDKPEWKEIIARLCQAVRALDRAEYV